LFSGESVVVTDAAAPSREQADISAITPSKQGRTYPMTNRRRLGIAAVTVTSAALAILGVGGGALASNVAAPGQIKACYKTGATLPPLTHIATSGKCPTGNSALIWNKVGPQGPAGVSAGTSGTSGTSVVLNEAQVLVPVLSAAAAPAGGTYYVNASVMLVVAQGDTVTCILAVNGATTGPFATVGPAANQTYETIPLSEAVSLQAGQAPEVECADYTANSSTSFYDGGITSVLINSATGTSAAHANASHHALPPRI
jgi:hypothetical protein